MKLNTLLSHKSRLCVSVCLLGLSLSTLAAVVGDGAATSCTQSILKAALDQGGEVTFNCGNEPHTIYLTEEIWIDKDVVIDGGGLISLDGRSKNRIFKTLGDREPNMTIALRNITLQYGYNYNEGGGAIHFGSRTDLQLDNVTFYKNESFRDRPQCDGGGGAFFLGYASTAIIKNSVFRQNKANNGGAMAHLHSDLDISDTLFEGNKAFHTEFVAQYNDCSGGGALYMDGARRDYDGGERWLKFRRVRFIENQVDHLGGALYSHNYDADSTLVEDCVFIGNTSVGNWGGGAIWHNRAYGTGRMYLNNTLIAYNSAHNSGGGIYADGPITMQNVTLYKNTVFNPNVSEDDYHRGLGGAINLGAGGETKIFNSTIVGNVAGYLAGAILGGYTGDYSSRPFIANTIISNNTSMRPDARQSCNQPMADGGGNIQFPAGDKYRCFDDALVQDPRLDSLADNGGLYPSIALQSDSPAIAYGEAEYCPPVDQRAGTRKSQCDSGAYEFGLSLPFKHEVPAITYDRQGINGFGFSQTRFNYRINSDSGLSGNNLSTSIHDPLSISIDVEVDPADVGKSAQLFLIVQLPNGSYKARDQQGNWLDWDVHLSTLPFSTPAITLDSSFSLDLFKQIPLSLRGHYQLWLGYWEANDILTLPLTLPLSFDLN